MSNGRSLGDIEFDESGTASGWTDDGGDGGGSDGGGDDTATVDPVTGEISGDRTDLEFDEGGTSLPAEQQTGSDDTPSAPEDDGDDTATVDPETGEVSGSPTDLEFDEGGTALPAEQQAQPDDTPSVPEDDGGETGPDLTEEPVPTEIDRDLGDPLTEGIRFASEETTIAGETYQPGEALPSEEMVARDIERQVTEQTGLGTGDVSVVRRDDRLVSGLTDAGEEELQREQRERAAQEIERDLETQLSITQDPRDPGPGGVQIESVDLQRGEDFQINRVGDQFVGEITEGFRQDFYTERVRDQLDMPDFQFGDDFTVGPEGPALTEQGEESIRDEAVQDIEGELESQYGVNLDRGDIAVEEREGQVFGTLSQEGERTVAGQTAPFADVPVLGGITSTGARLRQTEVQTTDPFREAWEERTPGVEDVGTGVQSLLPVGFTELADQMAQAEDDTLGSAQELSQEQLGELQEGTRGAIPGLEAERDVGGEAATAAAAGGAVTGVGTGTGIGTGIGTGTGTGTGVGTGLGTGTVTGAGTIGAGATASVGGFAFLAGVGSGDVERSVIGTGTPGLEDGAAEPTAEARAVAEDQAELPVGEAVPTSELDVSEPGVQQRPELGVADGVFQADEVQTPQDDVFDPELDPQPAVPESELGLPGQQTGQETGAGQTDGETAVPEQFPLPGRDMPADPSRDFVSGESERAVAQAQQLLGTGRQFGEPAQPTIAEEDVLDPVGEPDQPGPSVRERMRREDLFTPGRGFFTGAGAVVGRGGTEDAEGRLEEAQQPSFGGETSLTPFQTAEGIFAGVGAGQAPIIGAGVGTEPMTDAAQVQGQRQQQMQLQQPAQQQRTVQAQRPAEPGFESPFGNPFEDPPGTGFGFPTQTAPPRGPDARLPAIDEGDEEGPEQFSPAPAGTLFENPVASGAEFLFGGGAFGGDREGGDDGDGVVNPFFG